MNIKRSRDGFPFPFYPSDQDSESDRSDIDLDGDDGPYLKSILVRVGNYNVGGSESVAQDYSSRSMLVLSNDSSSHYVQERVSFSEQHLHLCSNYGFSTCTEGMLGCFDVDFFQRCASNIGFTLTPGFLLQLNNLRNAFSDRIVIVFSDNGFDVLLCKLDVCDSVDPLLALDAHCHNFASAVYTARDTLINFLISEIIPLLIGIINKFEVVGKSGNHVMGYNDRNKLFLHVVTVFERLIMLRVMDYWGSFCDLNRDLISSFPNNDYSNPLLCARDSERISGIDIPVVCHPAAFSFLHGACVSFMSIDYFNRVVVDVCAASCVSRLDPVIKKEIDKICNSSNCLGTLLKFKSEKMSSIIRREFLKIVSGCCKGAFDDFLDSMFTWPYVESNLSNLIKEGVRSIFSLVKSNIIAGSDVIISEHKNRIKEGKAGRINSDKEEKRMFLGTRRGGNKSSLPKVRFEGKYSMSGKCGFRLDKQFNLKFTSVKTDNLVLFRALVRRKFEGIIASGIIGSLNWYDVSERLLSVAMEEAREIVDNTYRLLRSIVSEARIVCDDGRERDLVGVEKVILNKNVMASANKKFKDTTRSLWRDVSKSTKSRDLSSDVVLEVLLPDLSEADRSGLSVIEDEFTRNFEPVVCETISTMLSGVDVTSSGLECLLNEITPILSERRISFLIENGFLSSAVSLLSRAMVVKSCSSRVITDNEKYKILVVYVRNITKRVDVFISSYLSSLIGSGVTTSSGGVPSRVSETVNYDGSAASYSSNIISNRALGRTSVRKRNYYIHNLDYDVVPSRFGSVRVCSEFNDDINSMISEHLSFLSVIVRFVRTNTSSELSHLSPGYMRDFINKNLGTISSNALSEFIDKVAEFVVNVSVYDIDVGVREINSSETVSFLAELRDYISLRHSEILFTEQ
ncbi:MULTISPECIES: hypothetical protein [Candidatus Ichthyocystis]|uniref:Uncharacterized protein n=1 Tax=Candidatus Ichthyocystis hellenicum TaxID=1561003 RepID=A0A0S4M354_9BURK|nr:MULTISPECIES: hypothetical protein [Ichthyocystis]CUT17707.1 hypothetical protein Ark11_0884 [Candidatus Ichthyocystis hellenicum]